MNLYGESYQISGRKDQLERDCESMFLVRFDELPPGKSEWVYPALHPQSLRLVPVGMRDLPPKDADSQKQLESIPPHGTAELFVVIRGKHWQ
jgi:hypothetical protein